MNKCSQGSHLSENYVAPFCPTVFLEVLDKQKLPRCCCFGYEKEREREREGEGKWMALFRDLIF